MVKEKNCLMHPVQLVSHNNLFPHRLIPCYEDELQGSSEKEMTEIKTQSFSKDFK